MKKIIIFSLVTILLLPQSTLALTEADYPAQNIRLYDPKSSACTEAAGSVSADLSKNIPSDWGKIFSAAAEKFDVNPNFLAALYLTEQGNT